MKKQPWWWPTSHGWVAIGSFAMSLFLIILMFLNENFRQDEHIKTMSSLVIGTGLVNGVIAFYYGGSSDKGNDRDGG